MVENESHHKACRALIVNAQAELYSHGISEVFNTLTGGRRAFRLSADLVSDLLITHFIPRLKIGVLSPEEILASLQETRSRGIRGGAIFDYLHLMSARRSGASKFYTLDHSNFLAFQRDGDPEILAP